MLFDCGLKIVGLFLPRVFGFSQSMKNHCLRLTADYNFING